MAAFPNGSAKAAPWKRGPAMPKAKFFTAIPKPAMVRDFDAVMGIVKDRRAQMVDARSAAPLHRPRSRNRAPACAAAICRAPSMCITAS